MKKFLVRAIAVFIMLVAFRAATTSIAPLINNLLTEMGYSFERQAIVSGVVLAVGYVASIFGSMFGGRIADRVGAVKTILVAGLIFAGVFMLWAFTKNGALFYINRTVLALCTGALYVALQSYLLGGVKKGREGMAMGIYGLAFGVGTALAGTASGFADQFGISEVYIGLGVLCVIGVVLGYVATIVDKRMAYPADFVPAMRESKESVPIKTLFAGSKKSLFILLLNAVVYGFGLIIFLQYLDELGTARGMAGTQAAFGIAVFSIISLLQPLAGMIADKIGKVSCIVIGQILNAIGWCVIAILPQLGLVSVLLFSALAGAGSALYSPATLAVAELSASSGGGGTIRGVYQGATSIGSAVAALFGSVIYMKIGIDNVFILLVVSCIIGVMTALWLAGVIKKEDQDFAAGVTNT